MTHPTTGLPMAEGATGSTNALKPRYYRDAKSIHSTDSIGRMTITFQPLIRDRVTGLVVSTPETLEEVSGIDRRIDELNQATTAMETS